MNCVGEWWSLYHEGEEGEALQRFFWKTWCTRGLSWKGGGRKKDFPDWAVSSEKQKSVAKTHFRLPLYRTWDMI